MTATRIEPATPSSARADAGAVAVRPAVIADLDRLVALEQAAFAGDRISRRSFRRFVESATAILLVAERGGALIGYALLLLRRGTALARLYSLAVAPAARAAGIGLRLLEEAEIAAFDAGCIFLRLEVREDNAAAIRLYRANGYRQFGVHLDYYEDDADALRFEKRLVPRRPTGDHAVPFYEQETDFTCGPACMMMALGWAERDWIGRFGLGLELDLWREATTIFMTSGHGGCCPYGIAVALARRGLEPEIHVSRSGYLFLDSVRNLDKRRVMIAAQQGFRKDVAALAIPVHRERIPVPSILRHLDEGALVMLLVSGYRMFEKKVPHWVILVGHDERHVFVHDPWVEEKHFETRTAAANLPIPIAEIDQMARYGKGNLRAAIVIRRGTRQ